MVAQDKGIDLLIGDEDVTVSGRHNLKVVSI